MVLKHLTDYAEHYLVKAQRVKIRVLCNAPRRLPSNRCLDFAAADALKSGGHRHALSAGGSWSGLLLAEVFPRGLDTGVSTAQASSPSSPLPLSYADDGRSHTRMGASAYGSKPKSRLRSSRRRCSSGRSAITH
ncbi:hypothetical protein MRX96_054322 [Rhipicephalus microplus]